MAFAATGPVSSRSSTPQFPPLARVCSPCSSASLTHTSPIRVRNADERNLLGLSRGINDLATRARSKKLNPDEVQGGTFTITNPGIFGALYGLPLINQPQVAILGVGTIEKRAVVIDDAIAIRPMCNLSMGYDHRLIDGADAGRFLAYVKERLENFDEGGM